MTDVTFCCKLNAIARDLRTYLSNRKTRLPEPWPVAKAIARMQGLHAHNGGATFSLYFGDMLGQPLYAVSLYPEPTSAQVLSGRTIPADILEVFIRVNRSLLVDPRLCIGIWYQAEENLTFLDIVAVLPDREMAIALGRQYNQIAIFDLASGEEIETEGTGEWISQDIPPERRLPDLERG